MKTDILTKGVGVLKVNAKFVTKNAGTTMFVDFPVDTLFDWYPLNAHYSYRYSEKNDLYYLVVDTEGLDRPRYGVADNKGAVNKKKSHMKKSLLQGRPSWYNEQVQEHNMEVFAFAESMGIKTPKEDFKQRDVLEGFSTFQKALDVLYDMALSRLTMVDENNTVGALDINSKQEYNGETFYEYKPNNVKPINGKDEETRAELVLAELNEDELDLYGRFGEVYTMLTMMQKIVIAGG